MLDNKTPKSMVSTICEKTKHYHKRFFSVFFSLLSIKSESVKHPTWGDERTLGKTCIVSFFELLKYKNSKMR